MSDTILFGLIAFSLLIQVLILGQHRKRLNKLENEIENIKLRRSVEGK